jgi:tryptophanyl-tRNA synthetase
MSKSDANPKARISITDSKEEIFSKIKAAVTDSEDGVSYDPERRPAIASLVNIAYYLGDEKFTPEEFVADCGSKKAFKDKLAGFVEEKIAPIRERYESIVNGNLEEVAADGAERAKESAEQTMKLVREAVGLK